MSASLETVAAKQAIAEVLYRYCHAVDRIDADIWKTVWHDGAVVHYEGIFEGSASDLMEFIFRAHRASEATSHQVTNAVVEVDGARAESTCYVTAVVRSGANDVVIRGRYLDRLSARDGEWRIDERRYQNDVMQLIPVGPAPQAAARS
jgi:hypothetical protein